MKLQFVLIAAGIYVAVMNGDSAQPVIVAAGFTPETGIEYEVEIYFPDSRNPLDEKVFGYAKLATTDEMVARMLAKAEA